MRRLRTDNVDLKGRLNLSGEIERDSNGFPIITILKEFDFLLKEKARYKVAYGGRGGGKSHSFARALLIAGMQQKRRIVVARETKTTVDQSVHTLLKNIIFQYELEDFYTPYDAKEHEKIVGINGTLIDYIALGRSSRGIKSLEGCNILWVEEAEHISKRSWDVALPTVRSKEGAEIWISFNPNLDTDETYMRFVTCASKYSIVKKINYYDLPKEFFHESWLDEVQELKETNYSEYMHIYEGVPRSAIVGAIYADELKNAIDEGRISSFDVVPDSPCFSAWDLGFTDMTSIFSWQVVGREIRVLDFFQERGKPLETYLNYLRNNGLNYAMHYLPWDSNHGQLAAQGKSIFNQVKDQGFPVQRLGRLPIESGISYCRSIFPRVWFNADRCMRGIECLKHYRYKTDRFGNLQDKPNHDRFSHGADAFRHLAIAICDDSLSREDRQARVWNGLVA